MKQKKTIIIIVASLLVILGGTLFWYNTYNQKNKNVHNYEECVAAGYPVMESYPEQCAVPGGKTFTHVVTEQTPISLEGLTSCLPHKNMDNPHTMECAVGLKTDDGKYYKLAADPYNSSLNTTDRRVRVSGTLKREVDAIYQIEGIITVTSHESLD